MAIVNGFDISMPGKERLVALLNAPAKMYFLDSDDTTILEVTTLQRSNANTKVVAQVDLDETMIDAVAAGFKKPPKRFMKRTFYVDREAGNTIHNRLGINCLPLGLTVAATDAQIIEAVNTIYELGVDDRDVLQIARVDNLAKITFKVASITYTGHLSVDITGELD